MCGFILGLCSFSLKKNSFIYLFGCTRYQVRHAGSFRSGMQTLSCGIWDLVPWTAMEPESSALGARSLSHGITREVPRDFFFFLKYFVLKQAWWWWWEAGIYLNYRTLKAFNVLIKLWIYKRGTQYSGFPKINWL